MLAIALVYDGMSRVDGGSKDLRHGSADAAGLGPPFNAEGPDGLFNRAPGHPVC